MGKSKGTMMQKIQRFGGANVYPCVIFCSFWYNRRFCNII